MINLIFNKIIILLLLFKILKIIILMYKIKLKKKENKFKLT